MSSYPSARCSLRPPCVTCAAASIWIPLPAAACVAIGFGIALWAVARVPIITTGGTERWRVALDRTIAFLGCATVLWYLGLAPMVTSAEPWSHQTMALVGLAFLLAVGTVTKVSYVT